MAKNLSAGAQQQAGAGGPVKTPDPVGPKANAGGTASKAASVTAAHQSATAPSSGLAKAAGHLSPGAAPGA